jgi:phosphatidylserine decarboxylase
LSADVDSARRGPGAIAARTGAVLKIAPEGVAIASAIIALGVLVLVVGLHWLGALVILCALAVGAFFRDPDRFPAHCEGVALAAADGRVTDIAEVVFPGTPAVKCRRVSVFMSPLNVHVNRAPVEGQVVRIEHTPGQFRAAFRDEASEHNERNLVVFSDSYDRRTAVMQVAGYLARRIVCRVRANDKIQAAQRIGLIMFGSRVDHFLPSDYRVTIKVGDRVRAGESVIGELSQ